MWAIGSGTSLVAIGWPGVPLFLYYEVSLAIVIVLPISHITLTILSIIVTVLCYGRKYGKCCHCVVSNTADLP